MAIDIWRVDFPFFQHHIALSYSVGYLFFPLNRNGLFASEGGCIVKRRTGLIVSCQNPDNSQADHLSAIERPGSNLITQKGVVEMNECKNLIATVFLDDLFRTIVIE